MRKLIGILALTMLFTAACDAADESTTGDAATPAAVVSNETPAAVLMDGNVQGFSAETLLHRAPAVDAAPLAPRSFSFEASGEPWLADATEWSSVIGVPDDDPRLQTIDERIVSGASRQPLAVQVGAERPSPPHEHTHGDTE